MSHSKTLAVYCWSPHIQAEGVNAVLDNLQAAGVTAVSTTNYVAEPAEPGPGVRREPPEDGGRGLARIIDRPLWGKQEQFLRIAPAFEPDRTLYTGEIYEPEQADALTSAQGHVVTDFIAEAKRRGMKAFMQISPSGRPPVRSGLSEAQLRSEVPRLPGGGTPGERMVHFPPLASPELHAYNAAVVRDILQNYPELDGIMLDRMEQSVYSFDDAFLDFGPHAERFAIENRFDFEAMRSAAHSLLDGIRQLSNADLSAVRRGNDVPYLLAAGFRHRPALAELLAFRSAVATAYLRALREAANSTRAGAELVPTSFPPPISLLTGADFGSFAGLADSIMIKFFTMHWPLIVTYWTQSITAMNPSLDSGLVARAVSALFDMEDEPSADLADYFFPGPEDPHRAGTAACERMIMQATAEADGTPVLPSVHAYGPMDDVERRWRVAWETGKAGMWVNRYGYLSEQKLALLKRVTSA